MESVGREIENAIQSMISISEEVANMKTQLDKATKDLNVLETLFSVSKYISSDLDIKTVISVLEDSVKGVFGASNCLVIFNPSYSVEELPEAEYEDLNYDKLHKKVEDFLYIEDAKNSELALKKDGSILLIKLAIGEEEYGFLVVHWAFLHQLSPSRLIFLRTIANQVSMYLKSAKLVEKFRNLAILDPMTGLYNRSQFSAIDATQVPELHQSIIMFDIDHFKQVNDNYGHQYGDKILQQFAEILKNNTADIDSQAFRYGGEEFMVECKGGLKGAFEIAETVRKDFFDQTGYTVSAGISVMGSDCNVATYNQLIESADEALYVAKQVGRNRTIASNSDIQVVKKLSERLAKISKKAYRNEFKGFGVRLALDSPVCVSQEQYNKIKQMILSVTRVYNDVFFTPSLDIFIFIDDASKEASVIKRIENLLKSELNFVKYRGYRLSESLDGIVLHNNKVIEVSSKLAKAVSLDDDEIDRLRWISRWHNVGDAAIVSEVDCPKSKDYNEAQKNDVRAWINYNVLAYHPMSIEISEWVLFYHQHIRCVAEKRVAENIKLPKFVQVFILIETFAKETADCFFDDSKAAEKAKKVVDFCAPYIDKKIVDAFLGLVD